MMTIRTYVLLAVVLRLVPFAYDCAAALSCTSPYAVPSDEEMPYAPAVCNLPQQPTLLDLSVRYGAIPKWMSGTLFRNVPSKFSFGLDQMQHWFDGMAQLQAYHFYSENNSCAMHSRFLETTSFVHFNRTQRVDETGFGTFANPGPLHFPSNSSEKMKKQRSSAGMSLNTNVCIFHLAGKFFATTDDATMVEFDGETLETLSPSGYAFADSLPRGFGASHGVVDDSTSEYFNFVQDFSGIFTGAKSKFYFWKFARDVVLNQTNGWSREVVGTVESANSTYCHSIGVTKNYIVWLELPYITDKLALMLGLPLLYAFVDVSKTVPMRMHLISRHNSSLHVSAEVPNFGCVFHTGNVFEDPVDGAIVYDSARSDICDVYDGFFLDKMLTEPSLSSLTTEFRLTRCRMSNPTSSSSPIAAHCSDLVTDGPTQFPWYNKNFAMRPYRFAYATLPARTSSSGELRKMDLTVNATVAVFRLPGIVLTEALFVPEFRPPDPRSVDPIFEDRGALLTVAFNVSSRLSEILAVNATSMELMFAVALPFAVPLHFHGIFCEPKSRLRLASERFCLWT